ncbi:MAG: dodecin family protein [Candidatus Nitrospinota bacterium M3_3B_026]
MAKTFRMIRLVGTSQVSYEDAINSAVADAAESLRSLSWFQVAEQRGRIDESGRVAEWQAVVDIAFRVEKEG